MREGVSDNEDNKVIKNYSELSSSNYLPSNSDNIIL